MTMTDPIADMLTRIRNGQLARKGKVEVPFSNFKLRLAELLKKEGYIGSVDYDKETPRLFMITLKYDKSGKPVISSIKRESKPGHRNYRKSDELPRILNDYGVAIISTSKGIMTNKEARKTGTGGEIICSIY